MLGNEIPAVTLPIVLHSCHKGIVDGLIFREQLSTVIDVSIDHHGNPRPSHVDHKNGCVPIMSVVGKGLLLLKNLSLP
jgi:hypothetical protein